MFLEWIRRRRQLCYEKSDSMVDIQQVQKKVAPIEVVSLGKIKKGASKNSYLIKSKQGLYVLKLFPRTELKDVQNQINLLLRINRKKQITIVPIHKRALLLGKNK